MVQKARDLSAGGVWFLTVRVVEVGLIVLLVGAALEARSVWAFSTQYSPSSQFPTADPTPWSQRITGMALYGGYRYPATLLLVAILLAGVLVVLHRCQPVSHTRVVRWEWLAIWASSALLALLATAIGAVALLLDDPNQPPDVDVVVGQVGPGYREQVLGNLAWPLGALLLLLPLALWWARLPDMDDLEDALAEAEAQRLEAGDGQAPGATSPMGGGGPKMSGAPASGDGPRPARGRRVTGERPAARGRGADDDSIFVDGVEQIEPVERLTPRGSDRGDGSSSTGYDGYFHRQ